MLIFCLWSITFCTSKKSKAFLLKPKEVPNIAYPEIEKVSKNRRRKFLVPGEDLFINVLLVNVLRILTANSKSIIRKSVISPLLDPENRMLNKKVT